MEDLTDIGTRIARTRHLLGDTQAEFADRLGVSPMTISRWENGAARPRGRGVRTQLLALIAAVARDHHDDDATREAFCVSESPGAYGADDGAAAIAAAALRLLDWSALRGLVAAALTQAIAESTFPAAPAETAR